MSEVLVTITIPIYNAMSYLKDSIQSVINQTYKDWILYLINDGSSDDSLAVMREFAEKDSRIKIIDDGLNRGLIERLNGSIDMCETKYYARMDADDIMYVTRIEEQVNFLEMHPEVDVCGTSIMTIDNNNNIVGSGYYSGSVKGFVHPTVMGRTKWFKANPYAYWALRAEDSELWTRTVNHSNFYTIAKPLLFYREFGIPTFKKYYLSQKTMIRIARRYRVYGFNFSWYLKTASKTYVKILLSALLALLGKSNVLVAMRKRTPVPNDLKLKREDLEFSIKTS